MNRSEEGQGGRVRCAGPGVAASARRWLGGALVAVALSASGCDSLLDVDLPGNITAETLNDPRFANLLATSAQGDFECAFNSYVWWSSYWTNDTHPANITRTNNLVHLRGEAVKQVASLGSAGNQPNCRQTNPPPLYMPLQTARAQAENAIDLIGGFSAEDVPAKDFLIGKAKAYKGYAILLLAEAFCDMTINAGPLMTREQAFDSARVALTEAIELLTPVTGANAAEALSLRTMARIGRARVALNLGDVAGVLAEEPNIPVGFIRNADRQDVSAQTRNLIWDGMRVNSLSATESYYNKAANEGLRVGGVIDPRVPVQHIGLGVGADGLTDVWRALKYRQRGSPIPLATWREMQLMVAEVQGGQVAVGIINTLRTNPAGIHPELNRAAWPLPAFASNNNAEIFAQVLEERRRELWFQGTRLGDMLRTDQPFRQGLSPKGEPYGDLTCVPLSDRETLANPNLS